MRHFTLSVPDELAAPFEDAMQRQGATMDEALLTALKIGILVLMKGETQRVDLLLLQDEIEQILPLHPGPNVEDSSQ